VSLFLEHCCALPYGLSFTRAVDSLHHEYNPLFFPFTYGSFDALVFMNDWALASVIVAIAFLSLLVLFVAKEVRKGTKNIWRRLLVE
jgi:hypothetical protein